MASTAPSGRLPRLRTSPRRRRSRIHHLIDTGDRRAGGGLTAARPPAGAATVEVWRPPARGSDVVDLVGDTLELPWQLWPHDPDHGFGIVTARRIARHWVRDVKRNRIAYERKSILAATRRKERHLDGV